MPKASAFDLEASKSLVEGRSPRIPPSSFQTPALASRTRGSSELKSRPASPAEGNPNNAAAGPVYTQWQRETEVMQEKCLLSGPINVTRVSTPQKA